MLAGAAAEFERDLPFSVFVDALDAYVASQELSEQRGWTRISSVSSAQVLPSLRSPAAARGARRTSATAPIGRCGACSS